MDNVKPAESVRARRGVGDWLDVRMNPVLLRDLRLYMRGKLFLYGYFLVLACLIIIAATGIVVNRSTYGHLSLLYPVVMILAFATGALVPYLVGERFRDELSSHAAELILASPLTAARLVRGKVYGTWCLSLMLFSVAMPVFVTSYLLGGISPYSLLLLFIGLVLAATVMPFLNIYLGTFGRRPGVGRLISALVLVGSFILMGMYGDALFDQILGGRYRQPGLIFIVSFAVASVLIAQFLYQVSVFRLRGPGLVREIRPRVSLAVAAVLGWLSAFPAVAWTDTDSVDWREVNSAAFFAVAWAFAWGIMVLARGNAVTPPNRSGTDDSRYPLTGVGPGSLAVFCSVSTVVLVIAGTNWLWEDGRHRALMGFSAFALAPLLAVGYGFAAYLLFQLRATKPPGADSLSRTIIVTNVLLGVVAFFFCTGLMFTGEVGGVATGVLAATPVGLLYLAISTSWYSTRFVLLSGIVGTVVLCALNLFLGWRHQAKAGVRSGDET